MPSKELLQLQDGEERWEAETFEELRTRLRDKYPDDAFERTLHYVRDHEAEERRERALSGLISLLAKAAVDDLIAEQSRAEAKPGAPLATVRTPGTRVNSKRGESWIV